MATKTNAAKRATLPRAERRVADLIEARLAAGRRLYGPLRPVTDARRWDVEALEEIADALVYVACELVRLASRRKTGGRGRRG